MFGLYPQKGSLQVGTDADIVLFDPEQTWTIDAGDLHSAAGYSPYEGMRVAGKVVMTYLRGRLIMGDEVYLGHPGDGKFLEAGTPAPYLRK
jgi:dihydropyrimidinase